jgi:hypothetical protein
VFTLGAMPPRSISARGVRFAATRGGTSKVEFLARTTDAEIQELVDMGAMKLGEHSSYIHFTAALVADSADLSQHRVGIYAKGEGGELHFIALMYAETAQEYAADIAASNDRGDLLEVPALIISWQWPDDPVVSGERAGWRPGSLHLGKPGHVYSGHISELAKHAYILDHWTNEWFAVANSARFQNELELACEREVSARSSAGEATTAPDGSIDVLVELTVGTVPRGKFRGEPSVDLFVTDGSSKNAVAPLHIGSLTPSRSILWSEVVARLAKAGNEQIAAYAQIDPAYKSGYHARVMLPMSFPRGIVDDDDVTAGRAIRHPGSISRSFTDDQAARKRLYPGTRS